MPRAWHIRQALDKLLNKLTMPTVGVEGSRCHECSSAMRVRI
jgi:hypothetical protein